VDSRFQLALKKGKNHPTFVALASFIDLRREIPKLNFRVVGHIVQEEMKRQAIYTRRLVGGKTTHLWDI